MQDTDQEVPAPKEVAGIDLTTLCDIIQSQRHPITLLSRVAKCHETGNAHCVQNWLTKYFYMMVRRLPACIIGDLSAEYERSLRTASHKILCLYHKYYSLNSNMIVTYGYDCENGVDECVKTMLIFAGLKQQTLHPTKEQIEIDRIICKIKTVIYKTIT